MSTISLGPQISRAATPAASVDEAAVATTPTPAAPGVFASDQMGAHAPAIMAPATAGYQLAAPAATRISAASGGRIILPEGAFIGRSDNHGEARDDMVLQLRKDPEGPGYYAVLSEYSRNGLVAGLENERTRLTDDVLRMQSFYVEHDEGGRYVARPLSGSADGELVVDRQADPSVLEIDSHGSMAGARLHLRPPQGGTRVEQIEFDGDLSVTSWEPFRPERYYLSMNPGAWDYLVNDDHNTVFSNWGTPEAPDYRVSFNVRDRDPGDDAAVPRIEGQFRAIEAGPGVFVLSPEDPSSPGAELMAGRLLVFFDLVNWKPFMTTNEALIIDPNDPSNVSFFYERHQRPVDRSGLLRALWTNDGWEHVPQATVPGERSDP